MKSYRLAFLGQEHRLYQTVGENGEDKKVRNKCVLTPEMLRINSSEHKLPSPLVRSVSVQPEGKYSFFHKTLGDHVVPAQAIRPVIGRGCRVKKLIVWTSTRLGRLIQRRFP